MASRDDPDEVARAVAYRAQEGRRAAYERARLAGLSGSRTARDALTDAWAPLAPDHRHAEQPPTRPEGP